MEKYDSAPLRGKFRSKRHLKYSFRETPPIKPEKDIKSGQRRLGPENPLQNANILSQISFTWAIGLLKYGSGQSLEIEDVWELCSEEATENATRVLEENWKRQIERNPTNPSIRRAVWNTYRRDFITSGVYMVLWITSSLFQVQYVMKELIGFGEDFTKPTWHGYALAVGLALTMLCSTVCIQRAFFWNMRIGTQIRSAINTMGYRKALRLQSSSVNVGAIVNLITNDCQRLFEAALFFHFIWATVIFATVITVILAIEFQWATIPGMVMFMLFFVLQYRTGRMVSSIRAKAIKLTDQRVGLMSEILSAMKLVKLYAWESSFASQVAKIRKAEIYQLQKQALIKVVNHALVFTAPLIAAFFTFGTYVLLGNNLNASSVFTTVALYNVLRFPLSMLPMGVKWAAESSIALERLKKFLLSPELQTTPGAEYLKMLDGSSPTNGKVKDNEKKAVKIKKGKFQWDGSEKVTLTIDDLEIPKGTLLAVVGDIGSGKSSFLSAILGEIPRVKGKVSVNASIAYIAQQPWLLNTTLEENITFGLPKDDQRYQQVLHDCSLLSDLDLLPARDQTEIGERGINLSGGQKQRVAIARAVYSNRDMYLLDDPLSAVDQHVGQHLFSHVIKGQLKDKTVVLVTHQLQYLSRCDAVLFLKGGQIEEFGTFTELLEKDGEFARLIQQHSEEAPEEEEKGSVKIPQAKPPKEGADGTLTQKEDRETGNVSLKIYLEYAKRSGGGVFISSFLLFLFLFVQAVRALSDWWLAFWVEDPLGRGNEFYLYVFLGMTVFYLVVFFGRGVVFFMSLLRGARLLHDNSFSHILLAPMYFFDSTPLGRILNRFSKDQDHIDETLPDFMFQSLQYGSIVLSVFVVIAVFLPWFILVLIPCACVFTALGIYYNRSSRELRRLDSLTRSPINAHLSSSLQGLPTIRAYNIQPRFEQYYKDAVDSNLKAFFSYYSIQRWLAFWLDFVSSIIVLASALFGVIARGSVDSSVVGLTLSYALQMAGIFQWTVRVLTETASQMTSVERLLAYSDHLETEEPPSSLAIKPLKNWPKTGSIKFDNVVAAYHKQPAPVLKGLDFVIEDKQKIGIVGRTGAGKSSVGLALFRMIEPSEGAILIDGVDISTLSLSQLRNGLSIIPQDPVLFTGTVRSNLDPFSTYTDKKIWKALRQVRLKKFVNKLPLQLDAPVVENGENFSVGQRQLFCIARALLKEAKILLLDEATAAVDVATDALIQKAIRRGFKNCTVLTIAHRLETIIDSDKVMVLDAGKVSEFDSPANLLKNPDSLFTKLVEATGKGTSSYLTRVANKEIDIFDLLEHEKKQEKKSKKKKGQKEKKQ